VTDRSPEEVRVTRTIDAWLELGSTELSDRVIDRARIEVHATPRRHSRRLLPVPWRGLDPGLATVFGVAAVILLAVAVVVRLGPAPGVGGPPSSPSPVPSPSATPAAVRPLPVEGPVFAGMYHTALQPALSLTVDRVVQLDCSAGSQCHGIVDIDQPAWVDMEFGYGDGSEIDIIRLDKVYDPRAPTKLIDPPQDIAAWIQALPGTAVFAAPTAVTVGGVPALQFDVAMPGTVQFGPMPAVPGGPGGDAGIGPSGLRVILVTVHGHLVLISEWLGPHNSLRDRPAALAALASLQPLVDSITWS
jgi:hypothetical protein